MQIETGAPVDPMIVVQDHLREALTALDADAIQTQFRYDLLALLRRAEAITKGNGRRMTMPSDAVPTVDQQERWAQAIAFAIANLPDPGLEMPAGLIGEPALWWAAHHIAEAAILAIVTHERVRADLAAVCFGEERTVTEGDG